MVVTSLLSKRPPIMVTIDGEEMEEREICKLLIGSRALKVAQTSWSSEECDQSLGNNVSSTYGLCDEGKCLIPEIRREFKTPDTEFGTSLLAEMTENHESTTEISDDRETTDSIEGSFSVANSLALEVKDEYNDTQIKDDCENMSNFDYSATNNADNTIQDSHSMLSSECTMSTVQHNIQHSKFQNSSNSSVSLENYCGLYKINNIQSKNLVMTSSTPLSYENKQSANATVLEKHSSSNTDGAKSFSTHASLDVEVLCHDSSSVRKVGTLCASNKNISALRFSSSGSELFPHNSLPQEEMENSFCEKQKCSRVKDEASSIPVVYFGAEDDVTGICNTTSSESIRNIEETLVHLNIQKFLLEIDKLKLARKKLEVEKNNIKLRCNILSLRKKLIYDDCEDVTKQNRQNLIKEPVSPNMKLRLDCAMSHEENIPPDMQHYGSTQNVSDNRVLDKMCDGLLEITGKLSAENSSTLMINTQDVPEVTEEAEEFDEKPDRCLKGKLPNLNYRKHYDKDIRKTVHNSTEEISGSSHSKRNQQKEVLPNILQVQCGRKIEDSSQNFVKCRRIEGKLLNVKDMQCSDIYFERNFYEQTKKCEESPLGFTQNHLKDVSNENRTSGLGVEILASNQDKQQNVNLPVSFQTYGQTETLNMGNVNVEVGAIKYISETSNSDTRNRMEFSVITNEQEMGVESGSQKIDNNLFVDMITVGTNEVRMLHGRTNEELFEEKSSVTHNSGVHNQKANKRSLDNSLFNGELHVDVGKRVKIHEPHSILYLPRENT